MKTAEQWMEESEKPGSWVYSNRFDKSFIEKIQLDAWKAGMTDAASLAHDGGACGDMYVFVPNIISKRDHTTAV